jgi:hypothetical protein
MDFKQNLFSANHRNAMLAKSKGTAAQWITVDDLLFEATMEAEYFGKEQNRGKGSPKQLGPDSRKK